MAIIGGRDFSLSREEIERKMHNERPEPFQKHVVEMLNTVYPPKQVVATVTGWPRTTFTTMEAQRALTEAGFICRRVVANHDGMKAWFPFVEGEPDLEQYAARAALEAEAHMARQFSAEAPTEAVTQSADGIDAPAQAKLQERKLAQVATALTVAQEAIASLIQRVDRLELNTDG